MRLGVLMTTWWAAVTLSAAATQPITLHLDATEAPQHLLHASLTVPAQPGHITLYYPKWIPGEHGPNGPITDLAGLRFTAGGGDVAWQRVDTDMNAFEVTVPDGASSLRVAFDLLLPPSTGTRFTSGPSASAQLAVINWNQVVLYPAGSPAREIQVEPSITLPPGWSAGTALPVVSGSGDRLVFGRVSLETLVDSPVIAGAHLREIPIGPSGGPAHFIEAAADSEEALEAPAALRSSWDHLVREALALFGATHYGSYRFLVALSDSVEHFGLEHHESSDDRIPERAWIEEDLRHTHATLLGHEFVHSWNGKYRRPADMATSDFQKPMRTSLLWVYEGLTQYLGMMLTTRSGLWTPDDYRDRLAQIAQWASDQKGRAWRPLADTAVTAQLLFPSRSDGRAWRRGTDFYNEGLLIWLDADTLIRAESKGRRSLEDFIKRFHGGGSGPAEVKTYRLEDLVRVLEEVHPHDWAGFFRERVDAVAPEPPLDGLRRAGWRLTWAETPSRLQKDDDTEDKMMTLSASIGLIVKEDGDIVDVIPDSPAARAGIGTGSRLVAVNGRRHSKDVLRAGIAATRDGRRLELLVENAGFFRTHALEYTGGERYPRLERTPGQPDLLSEMLAPRAAR